MNWTGARQPFLTMGFLPVLTGLTAEISAVAQADRHKALTVFRRLE